MIERGRPEACVSDLVFDRILAGELAGEDRDRAEAHLAGCAACRARRDELVAGAAAFPDQVFVAGAAQRALRASGASRPRWQIYGAIALPIATAAAILIWIALPARTAVRDEAGVRVKGGTTLEVVARRADGRTEALGPGATAVEGDAVRFVVSTDRGGHLMVLGLDSAGVVSAYVDAPIAAGRGQAQDGSVILDATPGAERFVAVVCPHRVELAAAAERALRAADNDPHRVAPIAAAGCAQAAFVVDKVGR